MGLHFEGYLSWEELLELAKKNYNNGGDLVVECWDACTYYQFYGQMTEAEALEMFEADKAERDDIRSTIW